MVSNSIGRFLVSSSYRVLFSSFCILLWVLLMVINLVDNGNSSLDTSNIFHSIVDLISQMDR